LSGGSSIIPSTETRSRRWAAVFLGVAFLVALSRIYLGKHYPSQVMVGAIIGVLWGFAAAALARKKLRLVGNGYGREASLSHGTRP
jgi:membrane-associated phospholipid phosphatase